MYIIILDDVDKDELEECIADLMDQEFDTILEDGSTMKVLYIVCIIAVDNDQCSNSFSWAIDCYTNNPVVVTVVCLVPH